MIPIKHDLFFGFLSGILGGAIGGLVGGSIVAIGGPLFALLRSAVQGFGVSDPLALECEWLTPLMALAILLVIASAIGLVLGMCVGAVTGPLAVFLLRYRQQQVNWVRTGALSGGLVGIVTVAFITGDLRAIAQAQQEQLLGYVFTLIDGIVAGAVGGVIAGKKYTKKRQEYLARQ